MNNTYLLTLNQVHSAVERYTTDALFARKLKCKPGFVQRGAVCQPMQTAGGWLGRQHAYILEEPAPPLNEGGSIVGGIAKSALAGGGVGLLTGVGSGLYDEFERNAGSPTPNSPEYQARNRKARNFAVLGGAGAGALTYGLIQPNIAAKPLDREIGGLAAGLIAGNAGYAGYGLGKNLTRMAVNALRERNKSVAAK